MCGIAGIFSFEGHIENPMQIYGMTDLLTHRGPDDGAYKFFLDDYTAVEQYKDKKQVRIAIGHRRLKIIDLDDRANQPFTDIDNKFTIIFNGEIYNYLEIAKELRELGTIFRTDSDTEVILESYKRWGCDCFKRFNGMWALAIVDSIKKKLILARDRLGKKPLYYMFDNGYFYFGSEIKSLNIINPNENRINYRKCSLYLGSHYRYVDSDNETFFDNIKQFPKACFWEVNEKTKPTCYWNLKEIIENIDQVKKEYDRLRSLHAKGFVSDLELEKARTAVKNASVVAPIAGVVTDRAVDVGESVSPGYSVMTVVDTDNPWSEIQIDEVDIAKVKIGQKVKLTTDAFQDKEVYGEIIWLNKEAELKKVGGRVRPDEEDLVFRAKVKFQDDEKMLKPGMSVYAEVIVGEKKNVLTVSRNAVTLRSGKKVVFVLKGRRVKEIEVKIGAKDIEKVEVNSGLAKGEKVAVSNLDDLKKEMKRYNV